MLIVNILLFVYLFCCYVFIFNMGSLIRIFLIVMSALVSSLILYLVYGFSWYLLLFILVYVGGVYVLFVYMSLILPNVGLVGYRFSYVAGFMNLSVLFFCCLFSCIYCGGGVRIDYSIYLCSSYECFVYLFFCLVLLLGIVLVNFIVGSLNCYLR